MIDAKSSSLLINNLEQKSYGKSQIIKIWCILTEKIALRERNSFDNFFPFSKWSTSLNRKRMKHTNRFG